MAAPEILAAARAEALDAIDRSATRIAKLAGLKLPDRPVTRNMDYLHQSTYDLQYAAEVIKGLEAALAAGSKPAKGKKAKAAEKPEEPADPEEPEDEEE
jgi:hypothetical protein